MPAELLGLRIHQSRTIVRTTEAIGRPGGEEYRFGQLRFACAALADNRDGSEAVRLPPLAYLSPRCNVYIINLCARLSRGHHWA